MSAAVQSTPSIFKVAQPTRHIDSLRPHPDNPRNEIDPDSVEIRYLADSIREHGIIEPLVITPDGILIAGHRRRVAARVAGVTVVPVTVRDIAPEDALELMLAENMQRQSLTPLEEARAFHAIMERRKLTVMGLARTLSLPAPTISGRLAIIKLEPEIQAMFDRDELPLSSAAVLARVPLRTRQLQLAGMLARKQITAPQLKDIVVEEQGKYAQSTSRMSAGGEARPNARSDNGAKRQDSHVHRGDRLEPTRAEAVAALNRVVTRKISLHAISNLLETVCCSCGMAAKQEICRTCPLPRFVLGIVGRSDF